MKKTSNKGFLGIETLVFALSIFLIPNLTIAAAAPTRDLTAAQMTNLTGSDATINVPFNFIFTVSNANDTSTFSNHAIIFSDALSSGASFGIPTVSKSSGISGDISCRINGIFRKSLDCKAVGGVSIPAGGTIIITLPVTPTALGAFVSPRSGNRNYCKVDYTSSAAGDVHESNENNNYCTPQSISINVGISPVPPPVEPPPITPPPVTEDNLILNPSLEIADPNNPALPQNWRTGGWGTNTTNFTYPVAGKDGQRAVRIDITSYTDGDARWQFDEIPVTPGDSFSFSDWYQSDTTTYPVVRFTNTDGSFYYLGLRAANPSSNWTKYSASFQVPYMAKTMSVSHIIKSVGFLTLDNYSMMKSAPKGFNRPLVTITFDNGFEDNITTAIPLLDQYGMKVTYCYSTEYIEGRIPDQVPIVKDISSRGHESCSHSLHHSYNMTTLTVPELDYELSHSQTYLQGLTGEPIKNFLTPFGAYNDIVVNEIKKYYRAHRPTDEGYNTQENFDQYRLTVQNMTPSTTLVQFKSWIDQAVKDKSWLILVYHRIALSNLDTFDTPAADFQPQLEIIKNSGITVKTMDQALDELIPQLGK